MGDEILNLVVAVAELRPHPRNYNRHDAGQIERLRESLRKFGQVRSVVVQAQGTGWLIVAGHGLVEAARAEGLRDGALRKLEGMKNIKAEGLW